MIKNKNKVKEIPRNKRINGFLNASSKSNENGKINVNILLRLSNDRQYPSSAMSMTKRLPKMGTSIFIFLEKESLNDWMLAMDKAKKEMKKRTFGNSLSLNWKDPFSIKLLKKPNKGKSVISRNPRGFVPRWFGGWINPYPTKQTNTMPGRE